jgi:hypothetical protein
VPWSRRLVLKFSRREPEYHPNKPVCISKLLRPLDLQAIEEEEEKEG